MTAAAEPGLTPWLRAAVAAAVVATDPIGSGGVIVRAHAGPVRERWLTLLRELLPIGMPLRRMPLQIPDSRLLGGLDLAATLRAGRPIVERGLLADTHGGLLLLPMAERIGTGLAARLAATMDTGTVKLQRDGIALDLPGRFGLVALDEGEGERGDGDEKVCAALADRAALWIDLSGLALAETEGTEALWSRDGIAAARERLADIDQTPHEDALEALCASAWACGVDSLRAPLLALRVARVLAALDERDAVGNEQIALAAQLVLAPRATRIPVDAEPQEEDADPGAPAEDDPPPEMRDTSSEDRQTEEDQAETDASPEEQPQEESLEDQILAAIAAVLPPALLAALKAENRLRGSGAGGRSGAWQQGTQRGRPAGVRRGMPERGARLNVVETLRAAAPWQPLRRQAAAAAPGRPRVEVRVEDFRVTRYRQPAETVTIFVVDASGSLALNRLAEAKGAVELLLADCYVRRDRVALIAFRGSTAELLLPPTRSLVRAKRCLAGLPGGGGTPLAAGLDAAADLAREQQRRGATALVVILTDGQANVRRDGRGGRAQAAADALSAARRLREEGPLVLLIDTGPRRRPEAGALAEAMAARYLQLPRADAASLSSAVRAMAPE